MFSTSCLVTISTFLGILKMLELLLENFNCLLRAIQGCLTSCFASLLLNQIADDPTSTCPSENRAKKCAYRKGWRRRFMLGRLRTLIRDGTLDRPCIKIDQCQICEGTIEAPSEEARNSPNEYIPDPTQPGNLSTGSKHFRAWPNKSPISH